MFKISGLDQLTKDLKKLEKNAKSLNDNQKIPVEILFNNKFMINNTNFNNFQEFVEAIPSDEEFENIDEDILDEYVCTSTNFTSWNEMLDEAAGLYAEEQFFKGVKF